MSTAEPAAAGVLESGESRMAEPRWAIALVVLVALAVYANSLANGFAFDDDWIIARNDRVHQLENLRLIWGTPYWPTFGQILGLYRPLPIFGYAVQWALGDGQPWLFHTVNLVLHAGVSVLVLLLLREFVSGTAALVSALLFAVHPVHTEAVANVVGQAELLAALATLATCLIYVRAGERLRVWHYSALAILYAAAVLSKEGAITLPALLVLLDAARPDRHGTLRQWLRQRWLLFFILAATAVLYLAVRVDVLGSISGSDAGPGLPFLREERRVLTAFRAWPEYVRLLFFPRDLSADYSPAVILPVTELTGLAALGALLLLATVVFMLLTPRHPRLGLPAGWFLISIFTVSNLVFPVGVVVAERTLYTPSVALAFLVAFLWEKIRTPRDLRAAIAAFILVFAACSYRTVIRNPDWKSTMVVLTSIIRDRPESYRSAWTLADQFWRRGDTARSRYYWEAALLLWPRDSQLLIEFANFNLGQRDFSRAIQLLEQSRAMHPWVPLTHELLALAYVNAGRGRDAIRIANEGIRIDGRLSLLQAIKARAYEQIGNSAAAVGAWRSSVYHSAGLWLHRLMLARSLARYGDADAALAAVDTALVALTDSTARATARAVRQAVLQSCYSAATNCRDPLADWELLVGPPTAGRPVSWQIATPAVATDSVRKR